MKLTIVALSACLLLAGCVQLGNAIVQRGRVVSSLQTVFGLEVSPSPTTGGYPGVRLGLVRNEIIIVLDGTNAVPDVAFETDIRNGNGLFNNSSVRRKVGVGTGASPLGPLGQAGRAITNGILYIAPSNFTPARPTMPDAPLAIEPLTLQ